jgi:hypothetical protein
LVVLLDLPDFQTVDVHGGHRFDGVQGVTYLLGDGGEVPRSFQNKLALETVPLHGGSLLSAANLLADLELVINGDFFVAKEIVDVLGSFTELHDRTADCVVRVANAIDIGG